MKDKYLTKINCEHKIKESFAEAGNPNQNPMEFKAIKWLKHSEECLRDKTCLVLITQF
jgi:hypothetical protein